MSTESGMKKILASKLFDDCSSKVALFLRLQKPHPNTNNVKYAVTVIVISNDEKQTNKNIKKKNTELNKKVDLLDTEIQVHACITTTWRNKNVLHSRVWRRQLTFVF